MLLTPESVGIRLKNHVGTWYAIATRNINGKDLFLLESEQYGDEAACVITDKEGNIVLDDVSNGFLEYEELLRDIGIDVSENIRGNKQKEVFER